MKVKPLHRVENIVAKGEIAGVEQFLLLSQCFQNASTRWKGLNTVSTHVKSIFVYTNH